MFICSKGYIQGEIQVNLKTAIIRKYDSRLIYFRFFTICTPSNLGTVDDLSQLSGRERGAVKRAILDRLNSEAFTFRTIDEAGNTELDDAERISFGVSNINLADFAIFARPSKKHPHKSRMNIYLKDPQNIRYDYYYINFDVNFVNTPKYGSYTNLYLLDPEAKTKIKNSIVQRLNESPCSFRKIDRLSDSRQTLKGRTVDTMLKSEKEIEEDFDFDDLGDLEFEEPIADRGYVIQGVEDDEFDFSELDEPIPLLKDVVDINFTEFEDKNSPEAVDPKTDTMAEVEELAAHLANVILEWKHASLKAKDSKSQFSLLENIIQKSVFIKKCQQELILINQSFQSFQENLISIEADATRKLAELIRKEAE